ncbi:N-acetylglucosamine-6-phosphate deacetylase [Chelatococcus sp. SYSU_G07232]|uniref:N-acetylglucosamine-6-phosphate deacetylase n=1 Tax=Chelatococcus albus TaxID=3047466 RepID=A0ABT7AFM1_9HYPH|nr:N-acetylglucosamine-6-phosphate deacetylase [Chelatococcus sp. SYSU_G07232]MDJ1158175.1 N-acetylglucosamine-6-phosphate deacetylase [Chelatococcus sp. SYSU_G07232]
MPFALTGARVFDGTRMTEGRAVVIEGERILAVPPAADLGPGIERREVEGIIAPGFIDVQVNGGGGVLFNDTRTADGIRAIGEAHRRYGTTGFLPTFITDRRERMAEAVAAAREALAQGVPGALGIHLEGPFLNPERKGVHDPAFMRPVEEEDLILMSSLEQGRTLVTLAPEMVPPAAIARLAQAGVLVSAGHTRASYETLAEARAQGLSGYTHLFNAMPPLANRDPGPVGAALDERESWCGLIVDFHHVAAPVLRVALKARGPERMMLVTDAMPSVGSDLATFELLGKTVYRAEGRLTTADGTLAGSDLDMASAVRNTIAELGISLEDALRMASLAPATYLRLDHELGRVAAGYRANLVLLDDDLQVQATLIDGQDAHG